MAQIIGASFPIPKKYMSRFFIDGKNVFIKPATIFKELKPGMKFKFYQSKEDTGFVGEALIKQIVIQKNPLTFFEIFDEKVFLTRQEVLEYISTKGKWNHRVRKNSRKRELNWIAIELGQIKRYDAIEKPEKFIPVSGKYIKE